MLNNSENNELKKLLDEYDNCWYNKDIEALKSYYSNINSELIYFDNHKNNDTFSINEHLELVRIFFQHGKETESGHVEEILKENMNYFITENAACICSYARYKSYPTPIARSTMYLENDLNVWHIKHVHCSFEPEK